MLIIERHFHYCWAALTGSQGLSCSSPHSTPPVKRLVVLKMLGGHAVGTADTNWPKGNSIPYGLRLSKGDKKKEEGDVQSDSVCFPKSGLHVMECLFPRNGWTPVSHGKWLIWLCVWLLLPLLNCFKLNPQRVFWQFFRYFLPNPSEEKESAQLHQAVSGWC